MPRRNLFRVLGENTSIIYSIISERVLSPTKNAPRLHASNQEKKKGIKTSFSSNSVHPTTSNSSTPGMSAGPVSSRCIWPALSMKRTVKILLSSHFACQSNPPFVSILRTCNNLIYNPTNTKIWKNSSFPARQIPIPSCRCSYRSIRGTSASENVPKCSYRSMPWTCTSTGQIAQ